MKICTKEGLGIAEVFLGDGSTEELKEAHANAKLIAAAPKLLDACREAESTIDYLMNNPKKYISQASCKMSLSKIIKAIKKATE